MKFYTANGDLGITHIGNKKLSKNFSLIGGLGDIDEFITVLGIASLYVKNRKLLEIIGKLQNYLFSVGSEIAGYIDKNFSPKVKITDSDIRRIEQYINELGKYTGSISKFILPGGSPGAIYLQNARAIARRTERSVIKIKESKIIVSNTLLKFMNRISTLIFLMGLYENKKQGIKEKFRD